MNRIPLVFLILLALFALSCNPNKTVGPADAASKQLPVNAHPGLKMTVAQGNRYIVDQQGNPVFLSGDAAWSLIAQLSTADAEYYFQQRSAYGFNLSLVNLIEHQYATHAPANYYNDRPFTGRPFATPNEAYFAHADQVIQLAATYGMIIALDATYIGYNFDSEGWGNEMKQATDEEMYSWGAYCGTRYKDFPNIIWVIGGDWSPSQVQSKLQNFINGLKATDPNHLITAHNQPESQAITPWPGQLTLNGFYTYSSTLYNQAKSAYNYSPIMPFIELESKYEHEHNSTAVQLRSQAYWTILRGGIGEIFGNNPTWYFSYGGGNWKPQMTSTGSASMKYMAALFRSRNWWNLVPDFTQKVMTSGYGRNSNYATTANTSDGSSIIAYMPNKKTFTINTSTLVGDSTDCWWYTPATGSASYIGRYATGSRSFTAPSSSDWVFVADAVTFHFGTPGVGTPQPPVPPPGGTISALPDTLPFGGGNTMLSWSSEYVTTASIDQGVGTVDSTGSLQVHVDATTTFTLSLAGPGGTAQYSAKVVVLPPPPPSGTFTAVPDTLPVGGGTTTLSWTSQDDTSRSIDHGVGKVDTSGSVDVHVDTTTTFTLTLQGFGGVKQYQKTVVVLLPPPPEGTFTAIPDTLPVGGGNTTISWKSNYASSATIDHGIGTVTTDGYVEVSISETTTYLLTLTGPGGMTQIPLMVVVLLPPPPTGMFTAIPDTLPVGGGNTTLSWTSSNAAAASIDHGIGAQSVNGSVEVSVPSTTTYTLTLTGSGGTTQIPLTVFVPLPPAPTGSLSADPLTLPIGGGATTLSWDTQNASTVTLSPGIGTVSASGSIQVNISATTIFTLHVQNVTGSADYQVTVTVPLPPPPTGTFSADPSTLPVGGGTTTLSWTSENATTVSITPGVGTVGPSGSVQLSVTATTTYTLHLQNVTGTADYPVTVTVPLPQPSSEILYDDALRNGWGTMRSWGVTVTPGNTTPVEDGTNSLKAAMSAWGSLQLATGNWSSFGQHDNTKYSALDFWVNAGSKAFVLYISAMSDSPGYSSNLKDYVTISLPANTWTHVTIPMSSLAASPFISVNFTSYATSATFYLDDVQLVLNQ
jgi:hypothetical protein